MNRADGIHKFGFRRWYERQLIESHAYLVTCFLSMILVAACIEIFSFRGSFSEQLMLLVLLMTGASICAASWRRYHVLMVRAECTGEQSTCEACRTYGRFKVMEPAPTRTGSFTRKLLWASDESDAQLKVHCRVCGHEWLIE